MKFEVGMGRSAVPNSSDDEDGFNLLSQSERMNGQNFNSKPKKRRRRKRDKVVIFRSHRPGDPVKKSRRVEIPDSSLSKSGIDLNSFCTEVQQVMKERL